MIDARGRPLPVEEDAVFWEGGPGSFDVAIGTVVASRPDEHDLRPFRIYELVRTPTSANKRVGGKKVGACRPVAGDDRLVTRVCQALARFPDRAPRHLRLTALGGLSHHRLKIGYARYAGEVYRRVRYDIYDPETGRLRVRRKLYAPIGFDDTDPVFGRWAGFIERGEKRWWPFPL